MLASWPALSICLAAYLFIRLSVQLSVYLSTCLYLSIHLSMSACLIVGKSIFPSLLYVCLDNSMHLSLSPSVSRAPNLFISSTAVVLQNNDFIWLRSDSRDSARRLQTSLPVLHVYYETTIFGFGRIFRSLSLSLSLSFSLFRH